MAPVRIKHTVSTDTKRGASSTTGASCKTSVVPVEAKHSGGAQPPFVKTFDNPDESNTNFKNAKIDIVKVGDQRVMRLVLQPGWKWSKDIKPTVGTDSCKAKHLGVIVSGAVCAKHDDGTELTYKAGDAYSIEPGHDGWVVGDKPAVVYEFHGKWGE